MSKQQAADDDRITKPEAAAILGVSEKAIERYTNQRPPKLSKETVTRPGGGFISYYSRKEVEDLKRRQAQIADAPRQSDNPTRGQGDTALARRQGDIGTALAAVVAAVNSQQNKGFSLADLATKASLTMEEAVALSGCSEAHLWKGINEAAIKTDLNGPRGSRRLSRKDVQKYAEKF